MRCIKLEDATTRDEALAGFKATGDKLKLIKQNADELKLYPAGHFRYDLPQKMSDAGTTGLTYHCESYQIWWQSNQRDPPRS